MAFSWWIPNVAFLRVGNTLLTTQSFSYQSLQWLFLVISALKYYSFPDSQFLAPQQCNFCFSIRSCLGRAWAWRVMYNDFNLLKLWFRQFLSHPAQIVGVQIKAYFIFCIHLQACIGQHHNIVSWGFVGGLYSPRSMLLFSDPTLKSSTSGASSFPWCSLNVVVTLGIGLQVTEEMLQFCLPQETL